MSSMRLSSLTPPLRVVVSVIGLLTDIAPPSVMG